MAHQSEMEEMPYIDTKGLNPNSGLLKQCLFTKYK